MGQLCTHLNLFSVINAVVGLPSAHPKLFSSAVGGQLCAHPNLFSVISAVVGQLCAYPNLFSVLTVAQWWVSCVPTPTFSVLSMQ